MIATTIIYRDLLCLILHSLVILIKNIYDHKNELLNTVGPNFQNKIQIRVTFDNKGFVYNSDKCLEYDKRMKEILKHIK